MENYIDIMKEKIAAADMVLVGIGEDFGSKEKKMYESEEYHTFFSKIREEDDWMFPYFYAKLAEKEVNSAAYRNLGKLLKEKNYFILSLRTDDIIYKKEFGLSEERIVTPCGGIRKMQCDKNCSNKVYNIPEELRENMDAMLDENADMEQVSVFRCPNCGEKLVFNRVGATEYCEENYLPNWERYTKWLQGTLNRNLCIIELGAGMKYPSIVRWPFEKMAFFNQKAVIFRIHRKLYQLTEELKEKGYSVEQDPIEFLVNSFE